MAGSEFHTKCIIFGARIGAVLAGTINPGMARSPSCRPRSQRSSCAFQASLSWHLRCCTVTFGSWPHTSNRVKNSGVTSVAWDEYMIDWFYSVAGFWTGVTRGDQKNSGHSCIEEPITFLRIGAIKFQDILGMSTRRDLSISGVYFVRESIYLPQKQANVHT